MKGRRKNRRRTYGEERTSGKEEEVEEKSNGC